MESADPDVKVSLWALRMIVAIPFLCLWGSLDAMRGADPRYGRAGWMLLVLIGGSLTAIAAQLLAMRGRVPGTTALGGQFVMGLLLTLVAVGPLWSPANLPDIRHAYRTIPAAFVLPPLTVVALANAVTFLIAARARPSSWRPAINPRTVIVTESLLALAVALGCAALVTVALAADPVRLMENVRWGGLIVIAVALAQLAVSARLALGGVVVTGSSGGADRSG